MSKTPPDPPARSGWLSGVKGAFSGPQGAKDPPGEVPLAIPVTGDPVGDVPLALALPVEALSAEAVDAEPVAEAAANSPPPTVPEITIPTTITCPACTSVCAFTADFCADCGYYFSAADRDAAAGGVPATPVAMPVVAVAAPGERVKDRYELRELLSERYGVQRYKALDHEKSGRAVVVVRQALPAEPEPIPEATPVTEGSDDELMPVLDDVSFGDPVPGAFPQTEVMTGATAWPTIGWERKILNTLESVSLPAEIEYFCDDKYEYLVLEAPTGTSLWDIWDDPDLSWEVKFGYLSSLAELLHRLHQCNAMVEGLRPDLVVVDNGTVRLNDLSDLLPLPFPPDATARGRLYTAPELTSGHGIVDARADLYHFGAMLYALNEHRELVEKDFDKPGDPKPFIPRYPDCHPTLGRLMMKTFRRRVEDRFPTDEASKVDATGFIELIRSLDVLKRTYDNVRLEIASWTSTGIIRTGNEDAYAVLYSVESRQDDLGEACLIILCDGMGGYEAGEVAAALTIQSLRKSLTQMRPFSAAGAESPFLIDPLAPVPKNEGYAPPPLDLNQVKQALKQAIRDANKLVFQTSRAPGSKRRGMGCTCDVVYVDGKNVIVGHVGDSRTYHLHHGNLVQMTRDQTLVNRLVELGTLSAEEAETHPRRNELQQAIGGQPDVEVALYHGKMVPGDWVVVCSDGLTNHVKSNDLAQMLGSEAWSAETAARRLVNLTLIEGASDNVTVVAVRAS